MQTTNIDTVQVEFVKQLLEEEKNSVFQNALHQKKLDPQRNQQLKEIRRKFKVT